MITPIVTDGDLSYPAGYVIKTLASRLGYNLYLSEDEEIIEILDHCSRLFYIGETVACQPVTYYATGCNLNNIDEIYVAPKFQDPNDEHSAALEGAIGTICYYSTKYRASLDYLSFNNYEPRVMQDAEEVTFFFGTQTYNGCILYHSDGYYNGRYAYNSTFWASKCWLYSGDNCESAASPTFTPKTYWLSNVNTPYCTYSKSGESDYIITRCLSFIDSVSATNVFFTDVSAGGHYNHYTHMSGITTELDPAYWHGDITGVPYQIYTNYSYSSYDVHYMIRGINSAPSTFDEFIDLEKYYVVKDNRDSPTIPSISNWQGIEVYKTFFDGVEDYIEVKSNVLTIHLKNHRFTAWSCFIIQGCATSAFNKNYGYPGSYVITDENTLTYSLVLADTTEIPPTSAYFLARGVFGTGYSSYRSVEGYVGTVKKWR